MKTTMLSKFLYGTALIAVVVAIIQWYIKFPDVSQLVFGLNVALTIIICAYIHSAFRNIGNDLKELNVALDTAINYIREIDDKIKNK